MNGTESNEIGRKPPTNATVKGGLHCLLKVKAWVEREADASPRPLVIGIGGPGGSGKSTVARWLHAHISISGILSVDDFRLPRGARPPHARFGSHPDANDLDRLASCFEAFRKGDAIAQPVFDRNAGAALTNHLLPAGRVLLADGEICAHRCVHALLDRLILVEAHWRTQLETRLSRDIQERGTDLEKAIDLFLQSNLRDYPRHAAGATGAADLVLFCSRRRSFSIRRFPGATRASGIA